MCNRIIILDQGKIQYDGGIKDIKSRDQYKIIEVVHNSNLKLDSLSQRFEVISSDPHKTRIKVSKENLSSTINYLNDKDILDLNINLISLEEIIREMYESKERKACNG